MKRSSRVMAIPFQFVILLMWTLMNQITNSRLNKSFYLQLLKTVEYLYLHFVKIITHLWNFFLLLMMDQTTGAQLNSGCSTNRFYEWPSRDVDGPLQCNVAVPYNLWNQRLRKPNRHVWNKLLHDFSIPLVGSKKKYLSFMLFY